LFKESYITSYFPKIKAEWTVFTKETMNAMKAMHMKQTINANFNFGNTST
jgi:hypothetical protein